MLKFENGKTPINDTNLNTMQENIETRFNEKIKGTVLYESDTGTTGNVLLSDSVANYDYIEIECRRPGFIYSSGRLYNVNGKTVSLSANYPTSDGMYIYGKPITIKDKQINVIQAKLGYMNNAGTAFSVSEDDSNYIVRVVGY